QQQLDLALKEAQAEAVPGSAAEHRTQEIGSQADILTEQSAKLSATSRQHSKQLPHTTAQGEPLQGEKYSGKRQAEELNDQLIRLKAESDELRSFKEQEARYRSSLEAQLIAHQEQVTELNAKVVEMQNEHARLEVRLEEERQSAAKGME